MSFTYNKWYEGITSAGTPNLKKKFSSKKIYRCWSNQPLSVSCQTIPWSLTAVPGSHGPKLSGSVIVPMSFSKPFDTLGRVIASDGSSWQVWKKEKIQSEHLSY